MAVSMIGPKFYAWDRCGKPLAFGKLYTYQARTNVPKATYQSEDQAVENTNPVILNGEGYANVYLSGSYKMVLKDDKDNEIWSSDPVSSAEPSEWVLCLTASYLSPASFKVNGNFATQYGHGRRVRLDNNSANYSYATIRSSVFAAGETTVTIDDPVVTTGLVETCISIVGPDSRAADGVINIPDLSLAVDATYIQEGDTILLKERVSGNGGGALWDVVLTSSVTPNDYNFVQSSAIPELSLSLRLDDAQDIDKWGANGDGSTGDSEYIKAAIDTIGKVTFNPLKTYFIDQQVDITSPTIVDLNGAKIVSDISTDKVAWFSVESDFVTIRNGIMGNGSNGAMCIRLNDEVNKISNILIEDLYFNMNEWGNARGFIVPVGLVINLTVQRCQFYTGATITSDNVCCIQYLILASSVDRDTRLNMQIINNISNGIPRLFDNFSNGFCSTIKFSGNVIRNGKQALRTYHIYDCSVSDNNFIECTDYTYLWQRCHATGNSWLDSGSPGEGAVKIEVPAGKGFIGNTIEGGVGGGLIVDGGDASAVLIDANVIKGCSGDGIYVNPNFLFGGQAFGATISNNVIYGNLRNGIKVESGQNIRSINIKGNFITANGAGSGHNVSGILMSNTTGKFITNAFITDNIITANDPGIGISDSACEWGIKYEGSASDAFGYIIKGNVILTNIPLLDEGSASTVPKIVAMNIVNDPTLIDMAGTASPNGGKFPTARALNYGFTNKIIDGQGDLRLNGVAAIAAEVPDFIGQRCYNRDVSDPSYYIAVDESPAGDGSDLQFKRMTP